MISPKSPLYQFFTHNISAELVEFFQQQLRDGKADFEARQLLIKKLDDIHARRIPPLPPGEYLWLHGKITRSEPPFDVSQSAAFAVNTDRRRTIEQLLAKNPGALKDDNEVKAVEWLEPKLTSDDGVTRGAYKKECIRKFNISEIGYDDRVWYAARYLVGLPNKRKSGRPKKK